ncbi:MAG: addiction module protein [Nitrospirae bacterium]|nr:addiction module protein [Nitrospirota bacterium]
MSKAGEQILAEALKLPPVERAELIENLFFSFEFPSRKIIDELWAQEVESRINAFDRGEIATISAEEVFAKIEKQKQ